MLSFRARCLVLFSLLLLTASVRAQTACPWLTQGTAETFLQGPVTVSTTLLSATEGTCTFTLQQDNASYALNIIVAATNATHCPDGSQHLAGIGNDATRCSANPSRNQTTDTVSSHIRDRFLTVQLIIISRGANPLAPVSRQSVVQQAAEEVAGNLF
jgi:hypothetical protein